MEAGIKLVQLNTVSKQVMFYKQEKENSIKKDQAQPNNLLTNYCRLQIVRIKGIPLAYIASFIPFFKPPHTLL